MNEKRINQIVSMTSSLSATELVELRVRLVDLWGDEPPAAGIREPRRPILPTRPGIRTRHPDQEEGE